MATFFPLVILSAVLGMADPVTPPAPPQPDRGRSDRHDDERRDAERAQRAIERAERDYERGNRALDERRWQEAVERFEEVAGGGGARVDGALYWKAYALAKLGRVQDAVAALDRLATAHPQSRWLNDARAMRVEIGQSAGRPLSPEDAANDDLKLMAINSLMQNDPERAVPLLDKLLQRESSPKLRERALFVLSQSDSPRAREVVVRVAKGGANPDLQLRAVRNLGVYGGKANRDLLADIYRSSGDRAIKRQVLNSFMVSGERDRILAVARSDASPEMRKEAVGHLGRMGANAQLEQLYASEPSVEVRKALLQALFVGGNARQLVEVARKERDPELRKAAVQHLSNMRSKEATDFLMELLNK
jgi:HEAT repeat protein